MKRSAAVIGYECLFDFGCDEWHLPPAVIGSVAGVMEVEGIVFDRTRLTTLLCDALEKRKRKVAETMEETRLEDIVESVLEEMDVFDPSVNRRIVDIVSSYCAENSAALDAAARLLLRLRKDSRVGLVCNVPLGLPHGAIAGLLRNEGMDASIDDMQFSTEMGMRRPHARQYRYVLSNLDVRPQECVAITGIPEDAETLRKLSFGDIFLIRQGDDGRQGREAALDGLHSSL